MWYVVALICGLFGALATLRGLELLFFAPSGMAVVQLIVGGVFLTVAIQAVRRARAAR